MISSSLSNPWAPDRWAGLALPSQLPLVTIGVLSYNRCNDLRRTLDCLTKAVTYPSLEIVVVDNASSDGTREMIASEFPAVRVIGLETNIAVAARNYFYTQATGKYVFSYDDDSFCATPGTISEIITFLEARSDIDAISFFCYQPITGFAESGELERFSFSGDAVKGYEGLFFVEGGMCIRRDSFSRIEGYDADFMWGAEGADLTLQLYKQGMKTLYHPGFATLHMKSSQNRNNNRNAELFTRNYLWTLSKHFPIYAAVPLIFLYILRRLVAIVLHPDLSSGYVKGILSGLGQFATQRRKCDKLSLGQVLGLKRWYVFLFRW